MTWILSLVPVDYFLYASWGIVVFGLIFYLVAKLAVLSVYYKAADLPLEILSIVSIALGVYLYGNFTAQSVWEQRIAELQHKVSIAEQKYSEENSKIITKIQVRNKIIHDKKVVVQEKIKEMEKKIDAECIIDKDAVDIINDASIYPFNLDHSKKKQQGLKLW